MNKSLLCTTMSIILMATVAHAATAEDAEDDQAYCETAASEQIKELRREAVQLDLVTAAINGVTSALLGSPIDRVGINAARTASYGQLARYRTEAAQRRSLERQCMIERKQGR